VQETQSVVDYSYKPLPLGPHPSATGRFRSAQGVFAFVPSGSAWLDAAQSTSCLVPPPREGLGAPGLEGPQMGSPRA
jgi:hypothetical protein